MTFARLLRPTLPSVRVVSTMCALAMLTSAALAAETKPKAAATPAPAAGTASTVLATVNGRAITQADLELYRESLPAQVQDMPPELLNPQILDHLIGREVMAQQARKDGLDKDAEIKRRLVFFETGLLQQILLVRKVDAQLTDAKLRADYAAALKARGDAEEVKAAHVLLNTKEDAEAVIKDLAKGGDFSKIAQAKSKDPSAKQNNGDLGWFGREQMVVEFATAAFAMKPGETSPTPVQTKFGWHVIRVAERRKAPPPRFEDMEPELRRAATSQLIDDTVAALRKSAKIETFGADGKPKP